MMFRTLLILGLGTPQIAGAPGGLALAQTAAPGVSAPSAPQAGEREALARGFAAWRADVLTRAEASDTFPRLQALVARAEELVRNGPSDPVAVELLSALYAEEFEEAERRLGLQALRSLFLRRLAMGHAGGGDAVEAALAGAAAGVVTPSRIEALVATAFEECAQDAGDGTGLAARRRLGPQAQMIAAAVSEAVEAGDARFVAELGLAALPPMIELASALTGERLPDGQLDPLRMLGTLDTAAALDVALRHCQSQDLLLKLRVLEAFSDNSPFEHDSVWREVGAGSSELVNPAWAGILESFYTEPKAPPRKADAILRHFLQRGYVPDGLEAVVPDYLLRGHPEDWSVARTATLKAAHALLQRERVGHRAYGVELLVKLGELGPVWGLAGTQEPVLRHAVGRAFRDLEGDESLVADDAYRTALRTFLSVEKLAETPVANERAAVTAALLGSGRAASTQGVAVMEWDLFQAVVSRPEYFGSMATRGLITHLGLLPEGDRQEAARLLTRAVLLPGVEERLPNCIDTLLGAQPGPDHAEAVVTAFEEFAAPEDWRALVEDEVASPGRPRFSITVRLLSSPLKLRIVRGLWGAKYDHFDQLDLDDLQLERAEWLELVADTTLPVEAREWALEGIGKWDGTPAPEGAEGIVASAVAAVGRCPFSARDLVQVGLDPEVYLMELLNIPGAPDEAILDTYIPLSDGAAVTQLLERFPPATWTEHLADPVLSGVITALVRRRDVSLNPVLAEANIPGTAIQSYLLRALNSERFVGHLPLGGALLQTNVTERDLAIAYVSSFTTDEAAKCLLDAMETAWSESYRDEMFAALQKMTVRREAAEAWRRGEGADARREAAIARLVALIEKVDGPLPQRAEAVRGLGLLDARDELPRLIELLGSEEEALRAAAREAIDRIGD